MKAHPLADRFPMLPEDELTRLAEDIRENGLRQPITVDASGRILDGRNRYAACQSLGIADPETVIFEGSESEVAALILSANVARRHQSTGSRAMSTALVLADVGKRENGRWAHKAVEAAGNEEISSFSTWRSLMQRAGTILDHAPDLAPAVVSGDMALDAAYREAEKRRDAERQLLAEQERMDAEEAEARARLEEIAPEYLERYESARQALIAWEDDNRAEAARARRAREKAREQAEADRRNAEQRVRVVAASLSNLADLEHPEARRSVRAAFANHSDAAPPNDRAMHTPDRIRALAGWLATYANEMEHK